MIFLIALNCVFRHLFHLHHVHGGLQLHHHHHDPELPPQAGGHARDARVGAISVPAVDTLAAENVQTWGEDNKEDNHDGSEDE